MRRRKQTSGFCSTCQKNVPHRRWIGNPILLLFDLLTLRITRLFRLGPWYCVHCDNKVVVLPLRRRDAIDYRSAALSNESVPINANQTPSPTASSTAALSPKPKLQPAPQPKPKPKPQVAPQLETQAESVGNFIKSESSLVKSTSLQRFSEKYRDAVVRRILAGSSSIKQVREEKNLGESEITEWIADLFERQQQKIDALERIKDSIPVGDRADNPAIKDFDSGIQTVPGQVRPR